jgi:hypothetical protein
MARDGHLLVRPFSAHVDPMEIEQLANSGQAIPIDPHVLYIRGG